MSGLKAGIAQVDYTPPLGLPLMGNFRDDYGARGVHDPLYAKAAVFADSAGSKVALLSVDICVMYRNDVAMMRQHIASQAGIAPEHILVAGTHTHSGPSAATFGSLPKADDASVEAFLKKAAEAVILADQNVKDSTLHVGYNREDRLSFNRRLKCKDGQTHMNWDQLDPDFVTEPLGPIDPQVIVAVLDTGVAYEDYQQFRRATDLLGTRFVSPWDFVDDEQHANQRPLDLAPLPPQPPQRTASEPNPLVHSAIHTMYLMRSR